MEKIRQYAAMLSQSLSHDTYQRVLIYFQNFITVWIVFAECTSNFFF